MSQINITVNSVQAVSLKPFQSETGALQNGSIKINGCTYSVSFNNDKLSVSRNFSFMNIFRRNEKKSIFEALNKDFPKSVIARNTAKAIQKSFLPHTGDVEVAMYGISAPRTEALRSIEEYNKTLREDEIHITTSTIDEYNAQSGITWNGVSEFSLPYILDEIKNGKLSTNETIGEKATNPLLKKAISNEKLDAWKEFLKTNADRLDIFGKISGWIAKGTAPKEPGAKKTGWAAEVRKFGARKAIEHFVAKNISPTVRQQIGKEGIKQFALLLIDMSKLTNQYSGKELSDKINKMILDAFFNEDGICHDILSQDGKPASLEFSELIRTAFFRQTSKLGLEFFKQQGTPVMFQWSDFSGRSLAGKEGNKEINDKWWNNKGTNLTKFSPITYSEMRHAKRLERINDLRPLTIIQVNGHN